MARRYQLSLKIHRYDAEKKRAWVQDYRADVGGMLRFTDVLRKINQEQDPGLAWISSCEHGQCGTCSATVNGRPLLMCELLVSKAVEKLRTTTFVLRPLTIAPVLRDLIVDMPRAYERVHRAKPFVIETANLPSEGDEHRISPRHMERYVEATRCINCFCCAEACISNHRHFLGPNALMANIVRLMDPKERATKERLKILYAEDGAPRCHTSGACSFVCPKQIDVAHFIALGKEAKFS